MTPLRVHLFGKFRASSGARPVEGLARHKPQELFSYLLLYRDRPHFRESLADILWGDRLAEPENPIGQSRKNLRQALWQLQSAVESLDGVDASSILRVEPEWIQLDSRVGLWLDVDVFEQAFALVEGVSGKDLSEQTATVVQEAVRLYGGDLMEGSFQDWVIFERERLQLMYLSLLDKLMTYCEVHHRYEAGIAYGMRILQQDRAHEGAHRRVMWLQYLAGDRTAALRQYERCLIALEQELGVKPSARTVALYKRVRDDPSEGPPLPHDNAADPPRASAPRPASVELPAAARVEQREQLIRMLHDLRRGLKADLERIALVLDSLT